MMINCNEQELHLVVAIPSVDVLELVFDNLLGPVQLEQVSILLLDILEWVACFALEYCQHYFDVVCFV